MKIDAMVAVRFLLLVPAVIGWLHMLMKRVHPAFAPGLLCGIVGSFAFLLGVFGFLDVQIKEWWIGLLLFLLLGYCLLIRGFVRRESFRDFLCWPYLLFLLLAGWFLYTLYGMKLTGYDDFTHWGIAARILVQEGRFPLPTDRGLTFQAYPPGSAVMIFVFSRFTGLREEWAWLYAQALTTICMFLPITDFGKGWKQKAVLTVVMLILLSKNTFFINLLVDTLVSGCALWCLCFCMAERENPCQKLLLLVPVMALFLTIKTSALFYAAVVLVYAGCCIRVRSKTGKTGEEKQPVWVIPCAGALVSFIPFFLWSWYVHNHFPAGMSSKHAFSIQYYRATFGDKTWDGVKYILVQLLKSFFSPSLEAVYLLLFGLVLAVFMWRGSVSRNTANAGEDSGGHQALREALVLVFASGAAYFLALAASYLLSMPWTEASVLAGFERYLHTFTVFACAILSVAMVEGMRGGKSRAWCLSAWLLLLLLTPQRRYDFYLPWPMEEEPRTAFDSLTEDIDRPLNRDVTLVFAEEPESWDYIRDYFAYMAAYDLQAPSVRACTAAQLQEESAGGNNNTHVEEEYILLIPEDTYDKLK